LKYFKGVPSPVKHPEKIDMVIFRENTEDIYAGIEWEQGTPEAKKVVEFLQKEMKVNKIRFPQSSSIGIKPVSKEARSGSSAASMRYAIENGRRNVTLVHKGNIQKYTEGMFMKWGYALAKREFSDKLVSWDDCGGKPPAGKILVKDAITDAFLQQILTRPTSSTSFPAATSPAISSPTPSPPRWEASASRPGPTSTTTPATPSSRRPTAPPQVRGPGQGQSRLGHPLRRR